MSQDGRLCDLTGLLLLLLLCRQPASVACRLKCPAGDLCPAHYVCCYDQLCCPLSERVAEIAGAVSGVILMFGGVTFCCIKCCRTRRRDASNPVLRTPAVVPTPAPATDDDGDHFTETSPLIHDQPVTYGCHEDIS
ncbi:uncharacterized protein LOC124799273 [Schistocerca piceifrons]|uniref:uncharacterized protein LOC124799273 n=1 Tax=Schistocerca piceifrons TaxID=274613 RepID=UPI001F5F4F9B|nr:uncharacterized protein LOC124799273 [Schistocerca piceifrons]